MACPLPSVIAHTDGATWRHSARGGRDHHHPFDKPFGVMKTLQSDIADARSAADLERLKNAADIEELRREVAELRRGLGAEQGERSDVVESGNRKLAADIAKLYKAIQDVRVEGARALRENMSCAAEDLDSLRAQVGKCMAAIDVESSQRKGAVQELQAANEESRNAIEGISQKLLVDLSDNMKQMLLLEDKQQEVMYKLSQMRSEATMLGKSLEREVQDRSSACAKNMEAIAQTADDMAKTIDDFRAGTGKVLREHRTVVTSNLSEMRSKLHQQDTRLTAALDGERQQREEAVEDLERRTTINTRNSNSALAKAENLTSAHFRNPRSAPMQLHCQHVEDRRDGLSAPRVHLAM